MKRSGGSQTSSERGGKWHNGEQRQNADRSTSSNRGADTREAVTQPKQGETRAETKVRRRTHIKAGKTTVGKRDAEIESVAENAVQQARTEEVQHQEERTARARTDLQRDKSTSTGASDDKSREAEKGRIPTSKPIRSLRRKRKPFHEVEQTARRDREAKRYRRGHQKRSTGHVNRKR